MGGTSIGFYPVRRLIVMIQVTRKGPFHEAILQEAVFTPVFLYRGEWRGQEACQGRLIKFVCAEVLKVVITEVVGL
jgi:hypothetical protein